MKKTVKMLIHDIFSVEMLKYMLVGVFTVIVDVCTYMILYHFLPQISGITSILLTSISNAVSWVFATAFAFFTNKYYVFQSKNVGRKHFWYEFGTFFGGRLLSFIISEFLLVALTDVAHWSPFWSKILVTIFVIVSNYLFAKLVIFKKQEEDFEKQVEELDPDVYLKNIDNYRKENIDKK